MNYTITFNPAIDLVIRVDKVQLGDLNRSTQEDYVAGGKGTNMSFILKRLGHDNVATGFLAGFSGEFIKSALQAEAIEPAFVQVDGITRINVKLKGQEETEINAAGPTVTQADFDRLMAYLDQQVQADDNIFLAGNAAPGLDASHYQAIAQLAQDKSARFILDSNKDLLTHCLPYGPFLIKPNHHELGEIFGVEIQTVEEIIHYAKQLQAKGARNVIVSRGGDGSLLLTESGEVYTANVPTGQVVNSVGAGDSMVAGFMAKYTETGDFKQSLQYGAATGSATAFSVWLATKDQVDELVAHITVQQLS